MVAASSIIFMLGLILIMPIGVYIITKARCIGKMEIGRASCRERV